VASPFWPSAPLAFCIRGRSALRVNYATENQGATRQVFPAVLPHRNDSTTHSSRNSSRRGFSVTPRTFRLGTTRRTFKLWLHPISGANSPGHAQDSQASDKKGRPGTRAAFSIPTAEGRGPGFFDWTRFVGDQNAVQRSSCFDRRESDCCKDWRPLAAIRCHIQVSQCLTLNF
jgi:hypothetical protein